MECRRYTIVISKYILAVLISIGVAIQLGVPDYLSAAFISVLTLQPNLFQGIEFSLQQIKGTLLGAGVTVALILLTGSALHPRWWMVQAAAAMGITIGLCLYAKLDEGTVIAIFTVAYLTCLPKMIPDASFFRTLDLRFLTIGIGLTTGFILNWGTSLFGYRDRLYLNLRRISRDLLERLERMRDVLAEGDQSSMREELIKWRAYRNRLEDVEIDLEQIERGTPAGDHRRVKPGTEHRRKYEVIHVLKDFSHHLWGLLLRLLKHSPRELGEEESRMIAEEMDHLLDLYRRLVPALVDPDTESPPGPGIEEELEERLRRVRDVRSGETSGESLRLGVHFTSCYETLREALNLVRSSS